MLLSSDIMDRALICTEPLKERLFKDTDSTSGVVQDRVRRKDYH
jgi:hypothetical protein